MIALHWRFGVVIFSKLRGDDDRRNSQIVRTVVFFRLHRVCLPHYALWRVEGGSIGNGKADDIGSFLGRPLSSRILILNGISASRTLEVNAEGVGNAKHFGFAAANLFAGHLVFSRLFHNVLKSDGGAWIFTGAFP
jgi:hypothetical protein